MAANNANADFSILDDRIMEAISAKALMTAVDMGLFDRTEGRTMTVEELAREMGLVETRLESFLDVLAALGVLHEKAGRYANTPLASKYLVSTAPLYQGDYLALTSGFAASIEDSIAELLAGGEADRDGSDRKWSVERTMEGIAQSARLGGVSAVADVAVALPGFDDFRAMCDIGGNHGLYTLGVLERNAALCGVIYDLPVVAGQARKHCAQYGYGDRLEVEGLDLRDGTLPEARYDLAVASHILYAFKDDLTGVLGKIAHGLKPGGWFVSHHYHEQCAPGGELRKASLELVTRLAGYASHCIGREELREALASAGFGEPKFSPVPGREMGLIAAARKR